MNKQLEYDMHNIDDLFEKIKLQGLDYLKSINNRKTSTEIIKQDVISLEDNGIGSLDALKLFNERFEDLIVASSGPRYLGYVIGGSTPASIIGDFLTTIYDQNPQTTNAQGDVSILIEKETISLLLDLFNLPTKFLGGFVTGASMSNFTCLATARQWIGKQKGLDFAKNGITESINILSAMPHSSAIKSLAMLGIGSNNFTQVDVEKGNREAISINDLKLKIKALNNEPFILISSAGTVNTADFDNFTSIKKLKEKHNFWWHIDAAFGAFAACSPKYSHLVYDWQYADSITIDCHKFLNVPYDSAIFFVDKKHKKLQVESFQNSNAPYLGEETDDINYLNILPENSRRLRALPAWFSLIAYGKKGYQEIIENSTNMANLLGDFIDSEEHFELMAPVRFNNVCFSLNDTKNVDNVKRFLFTLNKSQKVFMTPTIYKNRQCIRASFANWRISISDLEVIKNEMKKLFY